MITLQLPDEQFEKFLKKTRAPGFFRDPRVIESDGSIIAPQVRPGREISGRIFPNGEFGVGYIPHRGISAQDRRYEEDCRYAENNAEIVPDVQISPDGESFTYGRKIIPGFPPPKLGLGAELSQPSRKYGLKGITTYGRKMVRNAGHVMEVAQRGRHNRFMQMGTLTLPAYCRATMRLICSNWAIIVKRFFQECKRLYARYRYQFNYVSVTEIQPSRLQSRHEVGLHIHFLFCAIRLGRGKWIMSDTWVRHTWQRILNTYVGCREQSFLPNYRRERVSRSAAAYLAKYMSKGGEEIKQVLKEFGEDWLPSQWWSMDSITRKCIEKHTIRSRDTEAEKLLVIARWGVSSYVRYVRVSTLTIYPNEYAKSHACPEEIVLGYGGLLSDDGFRLFAIGGNSKTIQDMYPRTIKHRKLYTKKSS